MTGKRKIKVRWLLKTNTARTCDFPEDPALCPENWRKMGEGGRNMENFKLDFYFKDITLEGG